MATDPNKGVALAQPPRLTGNLEQDVLALREWIWAFYNQLAQQGLFISSASQLARFPIAPNSITFSDDATTAIVTFAKEQSDTSYFVQLSQNGLSGSPTSGSNNVASIEKRTNGFTVTIAEAPGTGASVSFDYLITRTGS